MEFSPQEHRPELEIDKLYQGTTSKASQSVPTTSNNETNYSNVPPGIANAYSFSDLTGSSGKNAQEQPKGLSSSGGMLAGMAATPMMLAQNAGTLTAPSGAQGGARGLGKAGSTLLRGAGKILGPVGGIILEGVFAEPAGGAKELEWERRRAIQLRKEREEQQVGQQIFKSQHGRGNKGDSGILQEADNLINNGEATNREDALEQLRKKAKQENNGKGDQKKLDKIKATEKAIRSRPSRETKDKKNKKK
jgi:hypothetical protein